jgi:hypothetical protein
MTKEEKPVFFKAILIVLFIILINLGVFFYFFGSGFSTGLTGMSIKKVINDAYTGLSKNSKIFLISQWSLLILFLIFAFVRDKLVVSKGRKVLKSDLKSLGKSKTDLDSLYSVLQKKKQLKILSISKAFKVKKSIAMKWCETLEEGNLAVIDYPTLGGPVLKLKK